ncbi:MAG: hypothetical protein R2816_01325 [Flavobacteriaceae bacterium]|nr:hypothetical protein [Flavobacteriaceae bacterium]
MIKRLTIIAIITGIGHLTTLLSLKYISIYIDNNTIALIGELDSLSLLIVSIVAFGLQLSATREIAIADDWQKEYLITQSARFTLSIGLFLLGFTGFYFSKNYLFFMAPIIALNADYALYGRGKPITGAFVALIRILIPSIALVIGSLFFKDYIVVIFSLSLILGYFLAGIIVSRSLAISYFVKPQIKSLYKYLESVNIGIASFALFFIGIGIINIMSYFYNNETIAVIYIALKLYMIFKGVRRIIVQSFFKELQDIQTTLKVDYFAIIAGTLFLFTIIFYPNVLIQLLVDEKFTYYFTTFLILGVAGFVSSFSTSSGTRLLLKKEDSKYSFNLICASLISIVSGAVLWLFFGDYPYLIAVSVLFGEIAVSVLNIISLKESRYILNRLQIAYPVFIFILAMYPINYLIGQTIFSMIISLLIFGILTFIYTNKRFKINDL